MSFNLSYVLFCSDTAMIVAAIGTFLGLSFFAAPYGKYSSARGWGPLVPAQIAWSIMESPNLWISAIIYFCRNYFSTDSAVDSIPNKIAILCFLLHYVNRSIIYPLRMSSNQATPMPLSVMFAAFVFCSWNGFNQSAALILDNTSIISQSNVWDLRFMSGLGVFFIGLYINISSDNVLIQSRNVSDTKQSSSCTAMKKYVIPMGGLFDRVSCANYFGEIVEWWGFALLCGSRTSFAFALYTTAYLTSRALHYHRWYQEKFEDYPRDRKAIIPFLL